MLAKSPAAGQRSWKPDASGVTTTPRVSSSFSCPLRQLSPKTKPRVMHVISFTEVTCFQQPCQQAWESRHLPSSWGGVGGTPKHGKVLTTGSQRIRPLTNPCRFFSMSERSLQTASSKRCSCRGLCYQPFLAFPEELSSFPTTSSERNTLTASPLTYVPVQLEDKTTNGRKVVDPSLLNSSLCSYIRLLVVFYTFYYFF